MKTDGRRMTEERENARSGLNAEQERKKTIEDVKMIEILAGSEIVIVIAMAFAASPFA